MSELEARRVSKDRISALPDQILCHILSFLTTDEAVMTIFLSKRWKNVWRTVPTLNFSDDDVTAGVPFLRFVDNVLFYRDSMDIQKFRLHCNGVEDFDRITGWIGAAIWRNVVELDLSIEYSEDIDVLRVFFKLPESLSTCKTLRVLHLSSKYIINAPASGCFPSLKSLDVSHKYPPNESLEKLFSCCPVLENLTMHGYWEQSGDAAILNFTISAPELKTLNVHWNTVGAYEKCYLYIAAPKLDSFHLWQCPSTYCFLENAKFLGRVTIALDDHTKNADRRFVVRVTALLAGISNVRYLSLSAHCLKGCCFPVFDKLSRLELALYNCYYWELLIELLIRSPTLEYLSLELKYYKCPGASLDHQWNPPDSKFICLTEHLKTVSIRGFSGKPDEMDVAKYFLKNCEVLKKMIICSEGLSSTNEWCKELSMFRWASKTCQVEFDIDEKEAPFSSSCLGIRSWV